MTNSETESESVQTVSGGSYYSATLIEPKSLFPSAVERVFNLLDALRSGESSRAHPSGGAIQWAKHVLLRVLPSYYLRTAEIDSFQGEIHVSWERGSKRVVVFLPSEGVLKLYLERTGDNGDVKHVLRSIGDAREINAALKWLFS
jgi:hypothetical protein